MMKAKMTNPMMVIILILNGNSEDVQGYHEYNDKGDPCRNIDILGSVPVLNDQGGRRNLRTYGYR